MSRIRQHRAFEEGAQTGSCKLTGEYGKFVKAHIIPRALTRPSRPGAPLLQAGGEDRPVRRWSSWYDSRLVTRAGEDILEKYDDAAIKELQRHKLLWSSWGPMQELRAGIMPILDRPGWGTRQVAGANSKLLTLFLLSLLWRAASSSLPEFADIEVDENTLAQIGALLRSGEHPPRNLFPVYLIQLSTRGMAHNNTPIRVVHEPLEFFRFYFDGLVAHFDRRMQEPETELARSRLAIGNDPDIVVLTVTYEVSRQKEWFDQITAETFERWPADVARFEQFGCRE
jgi:hypothetical protein